MELKLENKTVHLRFGVRCMDYFERLEGTDFRTAISRIGQFTMSSPNFLLAAAHDYCTTHKEDFEYTIDDAIDWYEQDKTQCQDLMAEGLKQYVPKNSKSPQETGMTQDQQ